MRLAPLRAPGYPLGASLERGRDRTMWVFFVDGFVSVVAHRDKVGFVLVRARDCSHLKAFIKASGVNVPVPILHTPTADYEWRAEMATEIVSNTMASLAASVEDGEVTNFKAACHHRLPKRWVDALHSVWAVCRSYQERR